MKTYNLDDSTKRKLAKIVFQACGKSNILLRDNAELRMCEKNLRGHIRSSGYIPSIALQMFGKDAKLVCTKRNNYLYVVVHVDGYEISFAHEPAALAQYRDSLQLYLFAEMEELDNKLTLHYKTNESNLPSAIWLEGSSGCMTIPVEFAYQFNEDEQDEAVYIAAEETPVFEVAETKKESHKEA